MAERKEISKKMRFEVFKRDKFTCQYCGRMSPDVILELDHIKPVAEGGKNTLLNLITSCRDCNRGKGKILLSQNDELKKQQDIIKDLAEKREQMEMFMDWRNELADFENAQADRINEYILRITGSVTLNEHGKLNVKKWINQFSFVEVVEAVDIAFSTYYRNTSKSAENALSKVGGICYNRRKQRCD